MKIINTWLLLAAASLYMCVQAQMARAQDADAPSSQLVNDWASQSKTFSAQMYLMWYSGLDSAAIPVPIGYETWSINGSAYNGTATPPWFLSPSSINSQAATSYTASNAQQDSYGMPVWKKVSMNGSSTSDSDLSETNGEQENQQ
jgi:hypothetical protein